MTLTTISKKNLPHLQILSPIALLSSLLKWQICLKKRGNTVQFIAWKQEDQFQVAAILYSLPMTGGLHMEINSGPFTRGGYARTLLCSLKRLCERKWGY